MAEASILTTWGAIFTGRETMGLLIFQEALAYYEAAKGSGKLEDYKVGICESGNIGALAGYIVAEGSTPQIQEILADEAYKRILTKAGHVVSFTVVSCATGTAVPRSIERLLSVRQQLGIS